MAPVQRISKATENGGGARCGLSQKSEVKEDSNLEVSLGYLVRSYFIKQNRHIHYQDETICGPKGCISGS